MNDLDKLTDEALLEMRFCDLPVSLEHSMVVPYVEVFTMELELKGIRFRPAVYLADEWLCPEGVPAIGIPFYLCHSRLRALERQMMLEVEGESQEEFLKLMRHEMGHAISYAYKFQNKPKWRKLFGQPSKEFSDYYKFKKYSRNYVSNIEEGYAQSHPDEDFAESFAVWMNPKINWRVRYKNWRVINKLEYVDTLMRKVKDREPLVESQTRYFNVKRLKSKLITHYKKRKKMYAQESPEFFDKELLVLFSRDVSPPPNKAYRYLQKNRKELISIVQKWTGQHKYVIDHLVRRLTRRSKEMSLYCRSEETQTKSMCIGCLTALVKNHFYTGLFKRDL
ncbi:putative zinc-binding metallopeptidase [PVC group bacterium]|nr:putative zinc-binding metallopeptidase [PVC group bacterium]